MSMDRVCAIPRSVNVSRANSFIVNGNIGYRLSYEQGFISVLGCCPGFTEVGDSCERKALKSNCQYGDKNVNFLPLHLLSCL